MKKVLSVTLASAMAVVTLAGCGRRKFCTADNSGGNSRTTVAGATEAAGSTKQVTRNRLRSGSAGGAANPDIRQPWKLLMHL